jgi:ABC-type uncharacterized transport system substrate-binding protein
VIGRREFMTLLGGAAAGWPIAARAQQPALPVIGFLRSTPSVPFEHFTAAFRQGLKDAGFVEGQNVAIEYRYADNHPDRLPALALDLVRRQAAVIACNGDAAAAAKSVTATIPIVFATGEDPVRQGLVTNLGRPDSNLTGVTFFSGGVLGEKRMELLHDLVPKAALVAVLADPNYGGAEADLQGAEAAGRALGKQIMVVKAAGQAEFDAAFAKFAQAGAGALLVAGGSVYSSQRQAIVALSARHALPTIYSNRAYVADGGLISYSASVAGAYRQVGVYTGRILKGAKPSDLPVLLPVTLELVINLTAARALGLEIPPSLLTRADEVIE